MSKMCKEILFSKLILILQEEIAISRKIKELLDQEKEYLVLGKMPEFEKTAILKESAVLDLEKQEKKRLELVKKIRSELKITTEELPLKSLLKKASLLHQEILKDIRSQYRKLIDEIKAANQRNNVLLKNSIRYVEYTLNLVTKGKDATYGKSGKKYYAERKLVNRVI